MRRYRYLQLDVFTHEAFAGNQLAVFPNAAGLSGQEMQAIAREMHFSETVFFFAPTDREALASVRIFTPGAELPFAGHPIIGTAFALAAEGRLPVGESPIALQLISGRLRVDLLYDEQRLSFAWMHQPVPRFAAWPGDPARLAAALGLSPEDLEPDLPIEFGATHIGFLYVPLRSVAALGRVSPAAGLRELLAVRDGDVGVYVFTGEPLAQEGQVRGRMFAPELGVAEDPATGSAAGPLGAYLLRHGRISPAEDGTARVRVLQGVEMLRASRIEVAVTGTREALREVRVGGEAVLVAEGELRVP